MEALPVVHARLGIVVGAAEAIAAAGGMFASL